MKFYPYQPSSWQITIPGLKGVVGFLVRLEKSDLKPTKNNAMSNHYSLLFIELGIDETFIKDGEDVAIKYAHSLIKEKIISVTKNI